MPQEWMIYGANGYTGQLVAQYAVERGHKPLIAGRNEAQIEKLAEKLDLDYYVFDLDDVNTVASAIADMALVYHAAGPFIHTSEPMIKACLATHTHYLDITGEIDVFEKLFNYDDTARKNGVALISGVGFDVVASDCLAKYVSDQLPTADTLETAFASISRVSGGTSKSALNLMAQGGKIRRDGIIQPFRLGSGSRQIRMMNGYHTALPIPWGDVATAYHSTGIPNITSYMVMPMSLIIAAGFGGGIMQSMMRHDPVRTMASSFVGRLLNGPGEKHRQKARSYVWAKASDANGQSVEAWLDTIEAYQFTAVAGILAVEQTLALQPAGALTPSLAFGADFVLEVENTRRLDALDVGDWESLVKA